MAWSMVLGTFLPLLAAVACLALCLPASARPTTCGFVIHRRPFRPGSTPGRYPTPLRGASPEETDSLVPNAYAEGVEDSDESNNSINVDDKKMDAVSTVVEISAAAGGATAVTSTVVTTAGGVCAGGACAAGAGLAATAAGGTGATAATAASAGGMIAGAKALLAGGALALSVAFGGSSFGASGGVNTGDAAQALQSMVLSSTPLEVAIGNGRPTVMEFYGSACPHCHEAARWLRSVEEEGRDNGLNWVMIDTDDPAMVPIWTSYGVDELPHFEFLDGKGHEVAFIYGEVGENCAQRIKDRVEALESIAAVQDR